MNKIRIGENIPPDKQEIIWSKNSSFHRWSKLNQQLLMPRFLLYGLIRLFYDLIYTSITTCSNRMNNTQRSYHNLREILRTFPSLKVNISSQMSFRVNQQFIIKLQWVAHHHIVRLFSNKLPQSQIVWKKCGYIFFLYFVVRIDHSA